MKIIKKIYILIILGVLGIFLASCKKTKYYKIVNTDASLLILNDQKQVIPKQSYEFNTCNNVTLKLDFEKILKTNNKITKEVTFNDKSYFFAPLDKEFVVELDNKSDNVFKTTKHNRETLTLNFNPHFFDVLVYDKPVTDNGITIDEASPLTISTKNLPNEAIVQINNQDQAINQQIKYCVLEDTTIRYRMQGEEATSDEQVLNSQLEHLQITPAFPDTKDAIRSSFDLPVLFDKTIQSKFYFKQNYPSDIKIVDNKLEIADGFNPENPVPTILVCELTRNNTTLTKEFNLTFVKKDTPQSTVTPNYLKSFFEEHGYFLNFTSNDNIKSITNNFSAINCPNLDISYEILSHSELLSFDKNSKLFVLNPNQKVSILTVVKVKADIIYTSTNTSVSTEFYLNLVPNSSIYPTETREAKISNVITISPENYVFNGKKVVSRKVADPQFFNLVTTNNDKSKFIFNSLNNYQVLYNFTYDDGTSETIRFVYKVSLPDEIFYVNRYHESLSSSLSSFKADTNTNVNDCFKVVGTDNLYLPDIVFKYNGNKLTADKSDFEKCEIINEIDFNKRLFKVNIKNSKGDEQNDSLYKIVKGTQLQFEEQANDNEIYTVEYYLIGQTTPIFTEKIQVRRGVNAYEDYELRQYFRELLVYDNIFLQRNIKVKQRPEVIKTKQLPSGVKLTYREYNKDHDGPSKAIFYDDLGNLKEEEVPVFDADGNITKEQMFYQGSLYYRYFSVEGNKKDSYKAVKFNGNRYTIDATELLMCHHTEAFMNIPNIQCAVFDIDSPRGSALPYHKVNEIKNIQIVANGGISGNTIKYDEGKYFAELAGSIHALRARLARVNYDNIITKDVNGVLWADKSEVNVDHFNSTNSFAFHLWYRNREPVNKEFNDIPMTRLQVDNSYFGETGGLGILLTDGDSRHRFKDEKISDYVIQKEVDGKSYDFFNYELHEKLNNKQYKYEEFNPNNKEDRFKYSCDPSLYITNTVLDTYASTSSSLVKSFNITDKIQVIEEKEEMISILGIKVLRHDNDNSIKINATILMADTNLAVDEPKQLTEQNGSIKDEFFAYYPSPRWDLKLNDSSQYYPSNVQYTLTKHAFEKLSSYQFLLTTPGENFVSYYNSKIKEHSSNAEVQAYLGTHLTTGINNQKNLPLNNFLQIFPLVEFPLFNNGNQTSRIYISVILGYEGK